MLLSADSSAAGDLDKFLGVHCVEDILAGDCLTGVLMESFWRLPVVDSKTSATELSLPREVELSWSDKESFLEVLVVGVFTGDLVSTCDGGKVLGSFSHEER